MGAETRRVDALVAVAVSKEREAVRMIAENVRENSKHHENFQVRIAYQSVSDQLDIFARRPLTGSGALDELLEAAIEVCENWPVLSDERPTPESVKAAWGRK